MKMVASAVKSAAAYGTQMVFAENANNKKKPGAFIV